MSVKEFMEAADRQDLARLRDLAEEAVALEVTTARLDNEIARVRSRLNDLRQVEIPDAMAEVGMSQIKLADGSEISISNYVSGSLPKEPEKKAAAIDILESNGGEALIKNVLSVPFDKKQHNEAVNLLQRLKDEGFAASLESTVHPSTLQAWVRERVREGEPLNYETLGCFVGRIAKIKLAE